MQKQIGNILYVTNAIDLRQLVIIPCEFSLKLKVLNKQPQIRVFKKIQYKEIPNISPKRNIINLLKIILNQK